MSSKQAKRGRVPLDKRTRRASRKGRVNALGMVTGLSPLSNNTVIPPSLTVQLKYQTVFQISASTLMTYESYSLNSPYDPLYGTGGGNCTGFPELASLYNYSMVSSCRVEATYQNTGEVPAYMFIFPRNSSQLPGALNRDLIFETPFSRYFEVFLGQTVFNPHKLTVSFSCSTLEGHELVPWIDYSCTASSDPTKQLTVQVGAASLDGATVGVAGFMNVVLTYRCTFWQKKLFSD